MALNQRSLINTARLFGSALRRSISTKPTGKSYVAPIIAGSLIAGTGLVTYTLSKNNFKFFPAVHASALIEKRKVEQTFIMIKPDGVARGLIAEIIKRFEQRGYKLVGLKMLAPSESLLSVHYGDLKDKPFYPGLVKHISSGPVVAMVWEGKAVVSQGRQMLGETDPLKSKPGSIRGDFSIDLGRNIIHGSDSVESAEQEIALWFTKDEIVNYTLPSHSQVFERVF